MNSISGDLAVMPVTDVLQWAELCGKTGTLLVVNDTVEKRVHLKRGRVLFVSSSKTGERLGEFLQRSGRVDIGRIQAALTEARNMKIPFTQRLVKMQYVSPSGLGSAVAENAKEILLDAARWDKGRFEFSEGQLPPDVTAGPVSLDDEPLLDAVIRQLAGDRRGSYKRNIAFFVSDSQRP